MVSPDDDQYGVRGGQGRYAGEALADAMGILFVVLSAICALCMVFAK
jgi:hypothetical protein